MKRTVFIVDDDDAVRASLRLLLETDGHLVEDFDSAERFLDAFDDHGAGCLIADLRMPGRSGLELQEALAERGASLPIIMLTGHADVASAVRSMKNGAVDFLQKPYHPQQLLDQVSRALALGLERRDAMEREEELRERVQRLTRRELEVMRRVATGQSNKVIAIELDISERTVELHRARGMKKLEARSVADVVRSFTDLDLLEAAAPGER